MAVKKVQRTMNYRLFERHGSENRELDVRKHRKLMESMKLYGSLECFPIICVRDANGKLIIKDGQHRAQFAETLGLPIYWIESDTDFDVALINSAGKPWNITDYAKKHAANGKEAYIEVINFSETHKMPLTTSVSLLSGHVAFTRHAESFFSGNWKVKDRAWADSVANLYGPLCRISPKLRNNRCLEACMAICRVDSFDPNRMISGAERCREKLVSYSTRDAYLDMFETVYNFGRNKLVGLKSLALMAMRERNPANGKCVSDHGASATL